MSVIRTVGARMRFQSMEVRRIKEACLFPGNNSDYAPPIWQKWISARPLKPDARTADDCDLMWRRWKGFYYIPCTDITSSIWHHKWIVRGESCLREKYASSLSAEHGINRSRRDLKQSQRMTKLTWKMGCTLVYTEQELSCWLGPFHCSLWLVVSCCAGQ